MFESERAFRAIWVVCGLLSACGGRHEPAGEERRAAKGLVVRTAPVASRDVAYDVRALGSLEPADSEQITAEVEGAVKEVRFQAGDRVTRETVLARIDPERYRLEAAKAEAAYRRAVADAKSGEADLARREALAKEQLVAAEELTRSRLEAEQLAADAAAAEAALELAQQSARRAEVRPTRSGEINTRTVDTGQFVRAGTVLATLVDPHRLRLRFKISDSESLKTSKGQTVRFRVAALGDRQFGAVVYHVGAVADPATRQVETLAWVDDPGVLKPGFFAEVTLATETHRSAVVVPEGAVQASESGFVVYLVEGGKARQRAVKLGLRTGNGEVEILSGLAAGETLVVEGSDRLAEGVAVESIEAPPAEPAGGVQR